MVTPCGNIGLTEISSLEVTFDATDLGVYKPRLQAFSPFHLTANTFPLTERKNEL